MSDFQKKPAANNDVDAILAEIREKRKAKQERQHTQEDRYIAPGTEELTPSVQDVIAREKAKKREEAQKAQAPQRPYISSYEEEQKEQVSTAYKSAPPVTEETDKTYKEEKPARKAEKKRTSVFDEEEVDDAYANDPLYQAMALLDKKDKPNSQVVDDEPEQMTDEAEYIEQGPEEPVMEQTPQPNTVQEADKPFEDVFAEIRKNRVSSAEGNEQRITDEPTVRLDTVADADKDTTEIPAPEKPVTEEIPFNLSGADEGTFTDTSELKVDPLKAQETSRIMNLNAKIDDDFRNFFSETVAVTSPAMEESGRKIGKKKIEQEEEWQPGTYEPAFEEDDVTEYESYNETEAVQEELSNLMSSLKVRTMVTGLISILLFYLGVAGAFHLPLPAAVSAATSPFYYMLLHTVLLLVAMLVSVSTVLGGLGGFFKSATADSLTAFSALGALVQAVFLLISGNDLTSGVVLFAPVAAIALFFNAYGKSMMASTIMENFEEVSQPVEKNVAYRLNNEELTYRFAKGLGESEPVFMVSRQAGFAKNFLKHSFSERSCDQSTKIMAIIVALAAVVSGGITLYISKDASTAVSSFAGIAVLGGSFSATLISAVPTKLMQQTAHKIGAVILGWDAVQEMKNVNVVTVQDKDLFPEGTVILHGIKTFEKERIDLAILYAASVLIEGSPTLRGIFLNVIENKTNILYPVENLQYENGCGFTAWIENNRVIIGNRDMMRKHNIEIPSLDYENKFTRGGERQPIYLSVLGKLFGMFVVSYHPDEAVADTLYDLERSGIAVAVRGRDFCLNSHLVSEVYEIPESYIKVLSATDQELLTSYTEYQDEADGAMLHLDSFSSFIGGLRAALAGHAMEKMATRLQWVATIITVIVGLFISITSGLPRLSVSVVTLYLAVWAIIAAVIPAVLKKY